MKRIYLGFAIVLLIAAACAGTKTAVQKKALLSVTDNRENLLPLDPDIVTGRLDNGLSYIIRNNGKPEKRLELRLVVRAGSVLENEDQRGLAHFVEHMAFNGTKNFEKQELVDYLESIGMRFGPEINAYTSFDETVYMLRVPTDSLGTVTTAFQILEDWAHNMSLDAEEIDKERGVIIEEWRLGRGADARMRDKQFPVLLHDSRYAERLPIGTLDVLEHFDYDTLRRFYHDWYRPDQMSVVAVGDLGTETIENYIREHFSGIEMPDKPREKKDYELPAHEKTLYAIVSDPEATGNSVGIYFKHDVSPQGRFEDYRRGLVQQMFDGMFNSRLSELAREADPPFQYGYASSARFLKSGEFYYLGAGVNDNGIERGIEALSTEAERVRRHGFTESELERQKAEMLSRIEIVHNERDKTESSDYASEYVRHFTTDEPIPGVEAEYDMYRRFIPGIELSEVNSLISSLITAENRVILVDGPEKDGVRIPDEKVLSEILETVEKTPVEPYVDNVGDEPLVADEPEPSRIVEEKTIDEIGVTEWRLANGVRIVLKPTDFKNDQIIFDSYSPGGVSLVADKDIIPALTATTITGQSGFGEFTLTELEKKLAGKNVSVSPYVGELFEGVRGASTPADLETMFQLIYLTFTAPRADEDAYRSFLTRMKGFIENRNARPETAFSDTLSVTLNNYDIRSKPWSMESLDEMNLTVSNGIYRDRFADAGDFTFFFVGNFTTDSIRPLVETWLGGLLANGRNETWRDVGNEYPEGIIKKTVRKGIEPKSRVSIVFHGPFDFERENRYLISAMADAFEIKLRETLREELGGTYSVGVSPSLSQYPDKEYSISISFGASPDRIEELTAAVMTQIDSLRTTALDEVYLTKVRETHLREREVNVKENGFWLGILKFYYNNGEDPRLILDYDALVEELTLEKIRSTAEKYFDMNNYVQVTLLPE